MTIIQFALLGLGAGAVYALLALGVVVIYKGTGVLNFAQGAFAMLGAYCYYELHQVRLWNTWVAVLVSVLAIGCLGALTHLLFLRHLRRASTLVRIIATLGILAILQGLVALRYGGDLLTVPSVLPDSPVDLGGVTVIEDRLWLLGIAGAVTVVLFVVSRYTRFGLATAAVAENQRAAATLGWSPDLIATVSWAAGAALAAAAGILVAPLVGLQGQSLTLLVIVAMAAGLLGGFTSYPLTLAGGIFIGVLQSELGRFVSLPGATASVPFVVIILALVLRGTGIPTRGHVVEQLPAIGSGRPRPVLTLIAAAVAALGILTIFSANLTIAVTVLITAAAILLSIVLLTGYAGQLSLAQFALAGLGAFIAGRAAQAWGWTLLPALIIGVLGVIPIGVMFALPALRTRGVALGVVTLGLGITVQNMVFQNPNLTGGLFGIKVGSAQLFGLDVDAVTYPERYALVCLGWLVIAALVVGNVRRNVAGRRLVSIRTNERAAASLGISVAGAKIYAFAVSSALAGAGGVLLAFQSDNIVLSSSFDPLSSITAVGNAVIGGIGYAVGPLIGGTFVTGSPGTLVLDALGAQGAWITLIGGVSVVITLLTNQAGVAGGLSPLFSRIPRRKARPSSTLFSERGAVKVAPTRLEVVDLGVRFGGVTAVDGVSFAAEPGQVVGLIGPNGAGKTTVIDAITGFVKPAAGTISLGSAPIGAWPTHRRARAGLCRSFQSLELFEDLTVIENLRTASDPRGGWSYLLSLLPLKPQGLSSAATAAIAEFDLAPDLERMPAELSYGRRRLVGIARSVATGASVLMLDEPAAGLDDEETRQLAHLIRRLAGDWGIAIVLIEHDMNLVMDVCDRIVVLEYGKKIADDIPTVVRVDPRVVAAYLGQEDASEDIPDLSRLPALIDEVAATTPEVTEEAPPRTATHTGN